MFFEAMTSKDDPNPAPEAELLGVGAPRRPGGALHLPRFEGALLMVDDQIFIPCRVDQELDSIIHVQVDIVEQYDEFSRLRAMLRRRMAAAAAATAHQKEHHRQLTDGSTSGAAALVLTTPSAHFGDNTALPHQSNSEEELTEDEFQRLVSWLDAIDHIGGAIRRDLAELTSQVAALSGRLDADTDDSEGLT